MTPGDPPARVDVAVVGGGPAALACAATLAWGGATVAILPTAPPSEEGALEGLGRLDLGLDDAPGQLVTSLGDAGRCLLGLANRALITANRAALGEGAVDLPGGALRLAANPREAALLSGSLEALAAAGIRARWLDGPGAARAAGVPHGGPWEGGILLALGGAFDPRAVWAGRGAQAVAGGAWWGAGGGAVGVEARGQGLALTQGDLRLSAEVAVVADGPRTPQSLPSLAGAITPARVQGLVTQPLGGRGAPWTANSGFEHGRWLPDGSLALSGFRYLDRWMGTRADLPPLHPAITARQERYLREELRLPEQVAVIRRWWRLIDVPCDGLPLAGALPGEPRIHVIAGLAGADFNLGLHLGIAVAQAILGEADAEDGEALGLLSPRRLV